MSSFSKKWLRQEQPELSKSTTRFSRRRTSNKRLRLEHLELRITPTTVCSANPTYEAECNYLSNLIPASMITDTAVKSGNWSNPATWSNGVPGNGANVWIPNGIKVTVDGQEPGALHSILDNGLLTFATNVNTSLLVDTIVVGTDNNPTGLPEGELDVGTTANPIQPNVTATITFADDGTLTQAWPNDPEQLARGLISMNTVSIVGATVTPYDTATGTNAGSTSITLGSTPTGWKVGDTLLLPGTSPTADQDEQITIKAISGNTVTLSSPLAYSHNTVPGQNVYVADEARNVVFQSQNTTDYERFGSIMFMHTDQEVVENADFLHLGRTNKSLPLGAKNPDGTTNVVGRYAVHFHRDYWPTLSENDPPILVSGNFEMGSPGWGYDNHSSNVDMEDNVAFHNNGAGFVTEAGNEIGTFNANLAVQTTGVPNGTSYAVVTSRSKINDYGFTGSGFWMQSPSVALTNNIALEDTTGFQIYSLSLTNPTLGGPSFNGGGYIYAWSGQSTLSIPLPKFSGDIAAESTDGIDFFFHLTTPTAGTAGTIVNDFTAWNVTQGVQDSFWATDITIQNSSLAAAARGNGFGVYSVQGGYGANLQLLNDTVTGFALGTNSPSVGNNSVVGGYWDDTTAFEITQQASTLVSNRKLSYSGITFGPRVQTEYQWDSQTSIENYNPNTDFVPQQVYINGAEAYFANEGATYVPFPTGYTNVPAALVGLTNAQLMQKYGLAMEGEIAGAPSQTTPQYDFLKSPPKVASPTYTLSYYTPNGIVTESTPITLEPGWNVITRTVNGTLHSWLVGYSDGSTSPPQPGGVSSYQLIGTLTRTFPLAVTTTASTIEAKGTSSEGAGIKTIMIRDNETLWTVEVIGRTLYVLEHGHFLKAFALPASAVYSFDIMLDTSNDSLSAIVNGTKYL
jgi:hypothetical protein